ncbi:MAG: hypothetical protein K2X47_12880 [Bdellovibrionales bacterium]|nr:hypothetical protein [Bdellovibrionales bacterium]
MTNPLGRMNEMKDLTDRIAKSVLRKASKVRSELKGRALVALDRVLLGLEKPKRFVKKSKSKIRPKKKSKKA